MHALLSKQSNKGSPIVGSTIPNQVVRLQGFSRRPSHDPASGASSQLSELGRESDPVSGTFARAVHDVLHRRMSCYFLATTRMTGGPWWSPECHSGPHVSGVLLRRTAYLASYFHVLVGHMLPAGNGYEAACLPPVCGRSCSNCQAYIFQSQPTQTSASLKRCSLGHPSITLAACHAGSAMFLY